MAHVDRRAAVQRKRGDEYLMPGETSSLSSYAD
jgi:hypothetical protein